MMSAVLKEEEDTGQGFKPKVSPRLHPRVKDCLQQKDFLLDLVDKYGSPLNVIFPENLDENIQEFQEIYKKHSLRGKIYYVTKANKSCALMHQAQMHDVGIDVSSPRSLSAALDSEWDPVRIVANGPKNRTYLQACIEHGVLINVDNTQELTTIIEISQKLAVKQKVKVGVRLCGFSSSRIDFTPHDNTFGVHIKYLDDVIETLIAHKTILTFEGFSFHIASPSEEQKIVAIENTLSATFKAIKRGLSPRSLNIGGGFPIMYADSCREWHDYTDILKKSVLSKDSAQTWNNTGLGHRMHNGVLAGGAMYTDHAPFRARGEAFEHILLSPLPDFENARFIDVLKDSLLELHIEPGKALLDQCGMTMGRVNFTKDSSLGEILVGLDMNRSNVQSADQKMLTEPTVLYRSPHKNPPLEDGVYYMGNLCLAYDMIQYNKTYPPALPLEGDVVVFANTGAYLMDFVESESLMQPVAKKIAVTNFSGKWIAVPDEECGEKIS